MISVGPQTARENSDYKSQIPDQFPSYNQTYTDTKLYVDRNSLIDREKTTYPGSSSLVGYASNRN